MDSERPAENASMNGWIEAVLDAEDIRRRCAAHGAWMEANPQMANVALAFGQANQQASLAEYLRKVDVQTLTNANTMLFKILATPER
jgi:hypothetical protein